MEFHLRTGGGREDIAAAVSGKWLVMPAVSIGNVGQLAVDILAATTKAEKVAIGRHRRVAPVVGPGSGGSSGLSGSLELFCCKTAGAADSVVLLQIRSEVVRGGTAQFLGDLLTWCRESGVCGIVLLSSLSAAERVDSQMGGSGDLYQRRFLANRPELVLELERCGLKELEKKSRRFPTETPQGRPEVHGEDVFIPSGGFTKRLFTTMSSSSSPSYTSSNPSLPLVCLMAFASEGNNTLDAANLVMDFDRWQRVLPDVGSEQGPKQPLLRFPDSWRHLFGKAPPPTVIY